MRERHSCRIPIFYLRFHVHTPFDSDQFLAERYFKIPYFCSDSGPLLILFYYQSFFYFILVFILFYYYLLFYFYFVFILFSFLVQFIYHFIFISQKSNESTKICQHPKIFPSSLCHIFRVNTFFFSFSPSYFLFFSSLIL